MSSERVRPGATTWCGLAIVALAAAVLSFAALRSLAMLAGTPAHLAWLFPLTLDVTMVVATRRASTKRKLSAETVHKVYRLFSASMRAAVTAERIEATPCKGIELPDRDPADEYFLTRAQFTRLRGLADDELLALVLDLGVGTGMRWGEIVGLHRHRIDLDHCQITVREVYEQGAGEIKPCPKGKLRRGVPITAELAEALRTWMAAHPPRACATPHRDGKGCAGSLLLPTARGTVIGYSNFRRDLWDDAVAAAELPGLTPHDLRHSYASWLLQSGVSIEAVSALLGHENIKTTQRYAHLADTQWDSVRGALGGASEEVACEEGEKVAPILPHEDRQDEGGKIVRLDRWRRSTG